MEINLESASTRNPQNHSQRQKMPKVLMKEVAIEYIRQPDTDISTREGLAVLNAYLSGALGLLTKQIRPGSLMLVVQCRTLEILERLWTDYESGHLNEVAESCLVSEKIRRKFDIESLTLKTTIDREDYLACRRSFTKPLRELIVYNTKVFS